VKVTRQPPDVGKRAGPAQINHPSAERRSSAYPPPLAWAKIGKQAGSGGSIPHVTIKTGIIGPDGREEQLREYICDYPGCPNIATHFLGVLVELRVSAAVCDEHISKREPPKLSS
jgi:hypothetical protein